MSAGDICLLGPGSGTYKHFDTEWRHNFSSSDVSFEGYGFGLIAISDGDCYGPELIEVKRTENGATFKAEKFTRGREEKRADLTLELRSRPGGLGWRSSVKGFKAIHGVRTSIRFIPTGRITVPVTPGVEVELEDEDSFSTPLNFARFAIFQCKDKTLWVHSMETPFKPSKMWIGRFGEGMILDIYI